jgi:predicted type IV restriction endonuclease
MAIKKKIAQRILKTVPKFQKIIKDAKKRDINESDTVSLVTDMLTEIFGFDKYLEITSELSIRGTFCDLAIKLGNKFSFLIECKAIGLNLKENHLKQAVNYGANKGIQWIVLTNATVWEIFRIKFEKPINYDLVATINFETISPKREKDIELLYLLTKEGMLQNVREDYFDKVQSVNKFIIGNLMLNDAILNPIKRELRKFSDGLHIELSEIADILKKEVFKREIVEGEEAENAQARLNRFYRKSERARKKKEVSPAGKDEIKKVQAVVNDDVLAEA